MRCDKPGRQQNAAGVVTAAGYGFGAQALRLSNAVTSGGFGDQTFSPALAQPAGESTADTHFDASFSIGTTSAAEQPGLTLSVSPDNGSGSRMSYLSFADEADGVHVTFYDATDPGPLGTSASFNGTDIATLDRAHAHTIRFSIDFVPGPANDVVRIYIDGALKITGTTWEDYYRYDPEQVGNGNTVPTVSKLLFRESGTPVPSLAGGGFLVDGVQLASSAPISTPGTKGACKHGGCRSFDGLAFRNQGACVSWFEHHNGTGNDDVRASGSPGPTPSSEEADGHALQAGPSESEGSGNGSSHGHSEHSKGAGTGKHG